ncbi:DUF1990 family protein, partial [Streptomyces sp. SBT349]|uniref:DUF1990 family protein n=1 Tax=Streptomyces sp. SBT349 TaxID=1580539 RepID=UPI00066E8A13
MNADDHGTGHGADHGTAGFTYRDVGATRRPEDLPPPGYRLMRLRKRVGRGDADLAAAGDAVVRWRMHRAAGLRVEAEEAEAAPGVAVRVGFGLGPLRLWAPCRVVWTVREDGRVGFGYGTLPGHPVRGEEAFLVERAADGTVWLTVTAFSRTLVAVHAGGGAAA